jgi:hypothetical protein
MRRACSVIFAVIASACRLHTGLAPDTDSPVVFELFRSECDGMCPTWRVAVHADGLLEYRGLANVVETGPRWSRVAPEQVARLRALPFVERGLGGFPPEIMHRQPREALMRHGDGVSLSTLSVYVLDADGSVRFTCLGGDPEVESAALEILGAKDWVASPHKKRRTE